MAVPGEVADGFIFYGGDRDYGESACAGQAGQWHGVSAVGCDAIPQFVGHAPAGVAFCGQIPLEPGATRASCLDAEEMFGF